MVPRTRGDVYRHAKEFHWPRPKTLATLIRQTSIAMYHMSVDDRCHRPWTGRGSIAHEYSSELLDFRTLSIGPYSRN
jgi:hypothetical protein